MPPPAPTATAGSRLRRRDVSSSPRELWRPPTHRGGTSVLTRGVAVVRRFFDIQEASIWRDLAGLLPTASGTVVDVGCGAQPFRRLLPQGTSYCGIDRADAKAHFGYAVSGVVYYEGDRWPLEDSVADVVLCTEVLEHVFDSAAFLDEARRCLRSDGALLLTVPFAARWHYTPHDYWRFTPSSLTLLLCRAGFDDVRVYQRGNPLTVAAYKAMALLLPIVMPQTSHTALRVALPLPGVLAMPVLAGLAVLAQLSLSFDYGDDCLGYTVLATNGRRGESPDAFSSYA